MRDVIDDAPTTLQTAATATGNGTALDVKGYAAVAVQITGTFSATVTAEVTLDGTNWVSTEGMKLADGSKTATATATGIYVFPLLGAERFRLRVSAYTSGSVTAVARGVTAAAGAYSPDVQLSAGAIDIGTVDQGTGGASAWLVDTELPAAAAISDALANPTTPQIAADALVWNGSAWERKRTPKVFKNGGGSVVGPTGVWTPAAGKKCRLMGYTITIPNNVAQASGGTMYVILVDASNNTGIVHRLFVPGTAATTGAGATVISQDLGNGYLSTAADATLGIQLEHDLTAGIIHVSMYGTEE